MTTELIHDHITAPQQKASMNVKPKQCRIWVNKNGQILDCCENSQNIFGYSNSDLKSRHISTLIPSLGETKLIEKDVINPQLAYRCHCGIIPFKTIGFHGRQGLCDLFINRVVLPSGLALAIICLPLSSQIDLAPSKSRQTHDSLHTTLIGH